MSAKLAVPPLVALLLCGCSTTATISRTNGGSLEAKIQRSTANTLVVQTDSGSEARISRSEITDIDHPGNATAVVGGLLGIYGGINIAAGAPLCAEKGASFCTGVFLPAIIGSSMLIWGLTTWANSSSAASPSNPNSSSSKVPEAPQTSAFDF